MARCCSATLPLHVRRHPMRLLCPASCLVFAGRQQPTSKVPVRQHHLPRGHAGLVTNAGCCLQGLLQGSNQDRAAMLLRAHGATARRHQPDHLARRGQAAGAHARLRHRVHELRDDAAGGRQHQQQARVWGTAPPARPCSLPALAQDSMPSMAQDSMPSMAWRQWCLRASAPARLSLT